MKIAPVSTSQMLMPIIQLLVRLPNNSPIKTPKKLAVNIVKPYLIIITYLYCYLSTLIPYHI